MAETVTPKEWTKGSIKTHIGWSTKTLYVIRGALLEGADGVERNIGPAVEDLAKWLRVEMDWLTELDSTFPDHLRRSSRASFLDSYRRTTDALSDALHTAVKEATTTGSVDPEVWKPVGVKLLAVLAHGESVARI
jgi:hypothetical protein